MELKAWQDKPCFFCYMESGLAHLVLIMGGKYNVFG